MCVFPSRRITHLRVEESVGVVSVCRAFVEAVVAPAGVVQVEIAQRHCDQRAKTQNAQASCHFPSFASAIFFLLYFLQEIAREPAAHTHRSREVERNARKTKRGVPIKLSVSAASASLQNKVKGGRDATLFMKNEAIGCILYQKSSSSHV